MKNAAIFHGTSCTPESFWIPYIKKDLIKKGYDVWVPQLPLSDKPILTVWLDYVMSSIKINNKSVLVGHSAGCPLIIGILEKIGVKIDKAILVAGYYDLINGKKDPMLKNTYKWDKIKNNVKNMFIINSDNDPWGCDDKQGRFLFDRVGGVQIILHGEGHMGSDKYNQSYKEFPLLSKLINY